MCGRFTLRPSPKAVAEVFGLEEPPHLSPQNSDDAWPGMAGQPAKSGANRQPSLRVVQASQASSTLLAGQTHRLAAFGHAGREASRRPTLASRAAANFLAA
jgi:hypothetical protein